MPDVYSSYVKQMRSKHETACAIADKLYDLDYSNQAFRMQHCTVYKQAWICQSCGAVDYRHTACRNRLCPICGPRRAREQSDQLQSIAKHFDNLKFITLTMPRVYNLWAGIQQIREGFKVFRQMRPVKAILKGGAYKIEAKPKSDGGWHVHLHIIADCGYFPKKNLINYWGIAINRAAPSVDIKPVQGVQMINDTVKYAAKASAVVNWTKDQLREWLDATRNLRMLQTWGTFFKIAREDLDDVKPLPEPEPCLACGRIDSMIPMAMAHFIDPEWWEHAQYFYNTTVPYKWAEEFGSKIDLSPEGTYEKDTDWI